MKKMNKNIFKNVIILIPAMILIFSCSLKVSDTIKPEVILCSPDENNISTYTKFKIWFSEPLDETTVTSDNIYLIDTYNNSTVTGSVEYNSSDCSVSFNPSTISLNRQYSLYVKNITDLNKNQMKIYSRLYTASVNPDYLYVKWSPQENNPYADSPYMFEYKFSSNILYVVADGINYRQYDLSMIKDGEHSGGYNDFPYLGTTRCKGVLYVTLIARYEPENYNKNWDTGGYNKITFSDFEKLNYPYNFPIQKTIPDYPE